ncbi:hypothetical protein HDK77DRAFT_479911 [Phyllosticta capitalensis]
MSSDAQKHYTLRTQQPSLQKQLKSFRDLMYEILELNYDNRSRVPMELAKEALTVLVEVDPTSTAFPTALKPFRELLDRMHSNLPPPGRTSLKMQEMHKHFQKEHQEIMKQIAGQSVPNGDAMHVGRDTVEDEESEEEQEEDSDESEEEQEQGAVVRRDKNTDIQVHARNKSVESTSSSKVCGQQRPTGRLRIELSVRETKSESELQLKRREGESIHARLERRRDDLKGLDIADDWVRIPVKWIDRQDHE